MKKTAVYGKGGIGKSITVSNASTTTAATGLTVMQIGCDPRTDSTCNLTGGENIPTVLNTLRERGDAALEDIVIKSPPGVLCVESDGPIPGAGCVGRGTITAFEKLEELGTYKIYRLDVVLYDVLGDVVYDGPAMPVRGGYADEMYIITSGEVMPLYAASNITHAVEDFGKRGYATLWGLTLSAKNVEGGSELVDKAVEEIEVPVLYHLPRHPLVQQAETQGETVAEAFPDSDMAVHYRELAQLLIQEAAGSGCSCSM